MRAARKPATRLRAAIDMLPERTKRAMLEGIRASTIVAGGYTDGAGGICPMLAAHRRGGRTAHRSFPNAWDRYTGARRARRATTRELRTLEVMLEASLAEQPGPGGDLARAAGEWRERKRELRRADTGERNRAPALRGRPGWAWLRPARTYEEYIVALELAEATATEREPEPV